MGPFSIFLCLLVRAAALVFSPLLLFLPRTGNSWAEWASAITGSQSTKRLSSAVVVFVAAGGAGARGQLQQELDRLLRVPGARLPGFHPGGHSRRRESVPGHGQLPRSERLSGRQRQEEAAHQPEHGQQQRRGERRRGRRAGGRAGRTRRTRGRRHRPPGHGGGRGGAHVRRESL